MACGQPLPTGAGATGGTGSLSGDLSEAERQLQLQQLLVSATLGEFEILGELGRGGMATVFLAHDLSLDRKVAIKVIAPALLTTTGAADRFKREARTAAALSHPHIIPIHAVRETTNLLYFVMKFVEGRALDDIVRERGPLPIRMVQTILTEVGQALAYAHRRGIVHRDIKPANIMIDGDGWAVVTDFGIAKVLDADALTASGSMIGTPYYMSPEQCAGKPVAGTSDQYSLGVVGYQLLTGRPPFSGDTIMEIMKGHFFEPPPPVTQGRADCPPELAAVVTRMLAKEPAERWPSLDEALAGMLHTPLAADDPIRTEMIQLARSSEALQLISKLSVPVSPVPAAALRRPPREPTLAEEGTVPEEGAAPEPARSRTLVMVVAGLVLAGAGAGAALLLRPRLETPAAVPAVPAPQPEAAAQAPSDSVVVVGVDSAPPAPRENAESLAAVRDSARAAAARLEQRRIQEADEYANRLKALLSPAWREQNSGAEDVASDAVARYDVTIEANGGQSELQALDRGQRLDDLAFDFVTDRFQTFPVLPASLRNSRLKVRLTFTPSTVSVALRPGAIQTGP